MIRAYFLSGENAAAAKRRYEEDHPNRQIPNQQIFRRLVQHLRDYGSFEPHYNNVGREQTRRIRDLEPEILDAVEEDPGTSTRRLASRFEVSRGTVHRILKQQGLHPYHVQQVQALKPEDLPRRVEFCQWYRTKCNEGEDFSRCVLWTDEAGFTREGTFNTHNTHVWCDENPHAIKETNFQEKFSINVWAGILNNTLIGPYIMPERLNGERYLAFLRDTLDDLLDGVTLNVIRNLWYQHDGAPPHSARIVTDWLNEHYENKWIGRFGPVPWPPRSPDLNPCDFYLWGHMKSLVYVSPPINTIEELQQRMENAANQIRQDMDLNSVRVSMLQRAEACLANNGGQFQHLP